MVTVQKTNSTSYAQSFYQYQTALQLHAKLNSSLKMAQIHIIRLKSKAYTIQIRIRRS